MTTTPHCLAALSATAPLLVAANARVVSPAMSAACECLQWSPALLLVGMLVAACMVVVSAVWVHQRNTHIAGPVQGKHTCSAKQHCYSASDGATSRCNRHTSVQALKEDNAQLLECIQQLHKENQHLKSKLNNMQSVIDSHAELHEELQFILHQSTQTMPHAQ